MPLTPQAGIERLRYFQLGKEATFKTAVPATRRYPWTFMPTIDPHWTNPTAQTGTLDQAIAPYRAAIDVTGTIDGQLYSDDVPTVISMGVMGGLSLTTVGTSKQVTATPQSLAQDVMDTYTGQWGDDVVTDAWQLTGGIINDFTFEYPQDLGPIHFTGNARFAAANYQVAPTGGLTTDLNPTPLYGADTLIYINDTAGAIGTTTLVDSMYGGTVQVNNNIDVKRMMDGNSTRFQVTSYSRAERQLDYNITFAKSSAAIAESVKWIAAAPAERFMLLETTSITNASVGPPTIPHRLAIRIPGFWFTRTDTSINTNTGFTLMGHQVYDTTLLYPFQVTSVSTRAAIT